MSQYQNDPIIQLPNLYINGLLVSNSATLPNTIVEISQGIARDSQNVMDLCVGVDNPNVQNVTVTAPLTVNSALSGEGGLDTGTIAANTLYAIYLIGDSRYYKPTAGMFSLAASTYPTMPFGYDSYRLIGYVATDVSSNFIKQYVSGTGNSRVITLDAPPAILTAGAQTSYTNVSVGAFVPVVDNTYVTINAEFTSSAAGNTANLKGALQVGDAVSIIAPVAGGTAVTTSENVVLAQIVTSVPRISYKVAAGTLTLKLVNYSFYV